MKRILFCLLLIGFHHDAPAQTVFAPVGATWQFAISANYYYHARAVGITNVDGKTCSLVNYYWHRKGYPVAQGETWTFCVSGDTVLYDRGLGRLRPLYIFNAHGGDTLVIYKGPTSANPDSFFHVKIDSLKPQLWGGAMLRTVWGRNVTQTAGAQDWIGYRYRDTSSQILFVERLGAIGGNGLGLWGPVLFGEEKGGVSCYYDGTTDARLYGQDSCNGIPEGIETFGPAGFSLYPNPATDACIVHFKTPLTGNARLAAYDVCGGKQIDEILGAGASIHRLETAQWPAGIYFLEVSLEGRKQWQKLLKE